MSGEGAPGRTVTIRPRGPYRLDLSARGRAGGTRRMRAGVLEMALRPGGTPARALVRQRHDGDLELHVTGAAPAEEALASARWMLAVDDDPAPFARMAAADRLLGPLVAAWPGLRPVRMGTVAQSVVAAMAGQLVTSAEAARTQARIVARVAPEAGSLRAPPTAAELAALSVAELRAAGLASRRAATLARVVRAGDPERLHAADSRGVLAWATRERGLGPWSAGVIGLYGLGRADLGLVGDLGLVRLAGALSGRAADAADTARLLAPYAPYEGLASLHLLHHPAAADRHGALARMA